MTSKCTYEELIYVYDSNPHETLGCSLKAIADYAAAQERVETMNYVKSQSMWVRFRSDISKYLESR